MYADDLLFVFAFICNQHRLLGVEKQQLLMSILELANMYEY
jgi:hypothetical protein